MVQSSGMTYLSVPVASNLKRRKERQINLNNRSIKTKRERILGHVHRRMSNEHRTVRRRHRQRERQEKSNKDQKLEHQTS